MAKGGPALGAPLRLPAGFLGFSIPAGTGKTLSGPPTSEVFSSLVLDEHYIEIGNCSLSIFCAHAWGQGLTWARAAPPLLTDLTLFTVEESGAITMLGSVGSMQVCFLPQVTGWLPSHFGASFHLVPWEMPPIPLSTA